MELMKELHREHEELRAILDCIDEALADIERAEAEVEFAELAEAMYFLTEYRDIVHHSKEALLLRRLARRERRLRRLVRDVNAHHAELKAEGIAFLELLEDAAEDAIVSREQLLELGRRYCASQRAHLQRLEADVLPRAGERLDPEDWQMLRQQCLHGHDATIERITREQRRRLHHRLAGAVNSGG